VGARQRDDPCLEGFAHPTRNIGAANRLRGERLDGREGVLDAMVELVDQRALARLRHFPLAHVDKHVDRADQLSFLVPERRRERDEGHARAVGPLGDGFVAAHRA
jgi:hypothetical protein